MTSQFSHSGFTMVELVIVIVLVGVLAATALPRFLSVSDDAHVSVVETTAGALQTSVSIANSVWRIHGDGTAVSDLVGYADNTWLFNASGFPVEGADRRSRGNSTLNFIPNANRRGRIWNGLLDHNPTLNVSGLGSRRDGQHLFYFSTDDGKFAVSRAGPEACEYSYVEEPDYKILYHFLTGTVTNTT